MKYKEEIERQIDLAATDRSVNLTEYREMLEEVAEDIEMRLQALADDAASPDSE